MHQPAAEFLRDRSAVVASSWRAGFAADFLPNKHLFKLVENA
jgi:hypothetical protein